MNAHGVTFEETSHPEMTITWPASIHIFSFFPPTPLPPLPPPRQFLVTLTSPEPPVQAIIFPNASQTCYITF